MATTQTTLKKGDRFYYVDSEGTVWENEVAQVRGNGISQRMGSMTLPFDRCFPVSQGEATLTLAIQTKRETAAKFRKDAERLEAEADRAESEGSIRIISR